MEWFNILNPRDWPGVSIRTGNNRVDGIYYNLLSSNHASIAASGSIFLAANSGIQLISPSFVQMSGVKATRILAENFGRIDNTGSIVALYPGPTGGIIFKDTDDNLISSNIINYNTEKQALTFPNATPGSMLYIVPDTINLGETVPSINQIEAFNGIILEPEQTDALGDDGEAPVRIPASMKMSVILTANSGISLGPNNNLNSYSGFILTHDGSGNVAQWKPATYLRENHDSRSNILRDGVALKPAFEGLETIGINWIRFPRRPALISNGKLYLYREPRKWSSYPPIASVDDIKKELGDGSDTLGVYNAKGEISYGYTKFAFVEKGGAEQILVKEFQNIEDRIQLINIVDPDDPISSDPTPCWAIDIAPEDPGGIGRKDSSSSTTPEPQNVFVFSVTKGAYFPMQLEPYATGNLYLTSANSLGVPTTELLTQQIFVRDDGTVLDSPVNTTLKFKPSTANNISIRPDVHTAFNMLGENIDFLIYGKENTPFNNYSDKFNLNDNYIPNGLVPIFKIDANIPNSVSGSPTGVIYSKFIDRQKIHPIGWNYDYSGKVCIKTNNAYVLGSLPSGSGTFLESHADVTISGHTYTTSLIAEDIYLKPIPNRENTEKYKRNALLTVDATGKIISRTPRINPVPPGAPSGVKGVQNGLGGMGNTQHSIIWDAPVDDGRSRIEKYLIQASYDEGENWIDLPAGPTSIVTGFPTQTSATIDGVVVNALFRVAAQNSVGISPYSEATETKFISNNTVPFMPPNFIVDRTIDSLELSNAVLSWEAPEVWGLGNPSGYLIEESNNNGLTWFSVAELSYLEESYDVTGLNGIDNYLWRIYSINTNNGKSAYNYVYSTGILLIDPDLEEEENRRKDELSNFDFNNILFTGICTI
jgi:hypothetical protein